MGSQTRWLTPIRIRLNSKREEAYVHAFKSLREVLRDDCPLFSVTSLQCVLFDFELGLSNAFSKVFGQDMDGVVKGCEVHWQRSAKAQSDKVTQGREERRLWWTMVKKVPQVKTRTDFVHLFEALWGVTSIPFATSLTTLQISHSWHAPTGTNQRPGQSFSSATRWPRC